MVGNENDVTIIDVVLTQMPKFDRSTGEYLSSEDVQINVVVYDAPVITEEPLTK